MSLLQEITQIALDQVQNRFYGVAIGTVSNVTDPLMQGRVKVRLPWFNNEEETAWARIATPTAGGSRGIYFIPKVDDEVLVAFEHGNLETPYVIGSLWNSRAMPPEQTPLQGKSVIKTETGHILEFDDLQQSIKIATATDQKVTLDPTKIELSNAAGTMKITMDDSAQTLKIESATKLQLKGLDIKIEGTNVEISGSAKTDVKSGGVLTIQGSIVKIN